MKRKTLLSLTASALILMTGFEVKGVTHLPGFSPFGSPIEHYPGCEAPPPVGNACTPLWSPVTHWIDPPLAIVTWLDWYATKDQYEKSVNADEALKKLNKALSPGCGGKQEDGSKSSLTPTDNLPVAPDVVTSLLDDADSLEAVRVVAETYLSESGDCNQDCMVQRQNEWLLTSLALAVGASDKLLSVSDDMSKEYGDLLKDFNSQTGPKGMWGSSSQITLHTHVQQNDINALYARDLEINALNGVRETVKIDCEHKVGDETCPNVARHRVPKSGNVGHSWFCQEHAPKK